MQEDKTLEELNEECFSLFAKIAELPDLEIYNAEEIEDGS